MKKNNLKFIVCGGAGFIGSNMSDYLVSLGHDVVIIDNLSTGNIKNLNKKTIFYNLDISDKQNIEKIRHLCNYYDYLIHMAATPNVQGSIDFPLDSHDNNFQTTINILEAMRGTKIKKIVFSSTSAVYGDTEKYPTDENCNLNILSPYGLQKLMSEKYIELYSKIFGINGVCLRYFNVFGDRMTNHGAYKSVISIFKEQYESNLPLTITNDGNQRRDFIHVDDVVEANYLSCIFDTGNFEIFNVGFGDNISVNEIASYFNHPTTNIGTRIEPFLTLCDSGKIKSVLKWSPTISVKEWLNSNLNKKHSND
jgi:UDP-glucose 4-epimerase